MSPRAANRLGWAFLLAVASSPRVGWTQQDTVSVTAGERYRARSEIHATLLGERYRELWTSSIRVPVLDLGTFGGGLTPIRTGGSRQTRSLRFRAGDGREYEFRPIDKELGAAMPDWAKGTLVEWLRQDQTSSQLPAAPLVATELLDAVGVLNPGPRLFVLPDDARLGEYRRDFAGILGTLETRAIAKPGSGPEFANALEIVDTERMLELVSSDPDHRVDSRAFLAARLMDVFLGDYDRHAGQWRWARYATGGTHRWVPIPEDRDYAFVDYDGTLLQIGRMAGVRRAIRFEETYPNLLGMVQNSLALNQRLLAELPREVWDSTAAALQTLLTDRVISDAVARMPAPHVELAGADLERRLRARRDALREMAARLFALHNRVVEIHATQQPDRAEIVRRPDGRLSVRIGRTADGAGDYFHRLFEAGETSEVRIHLHGGDDRARVEGMGSPVVVRVIGGRGDDHLIDAGAGHTTFYDAHGENRIQEGPGTRVSLRDRRDAPDADPLLPELVRDWGTSSGLYVPSAELRAHVQLVVGLGPELTRYAFRHEPYAMKVYARGLFAPLHLRKGFEAGAKLHRESSPTSVELFASAADLDASMFHGMGNGSARQPSATARVWHDRFTGRALVHRHLSTRARATAGIVAEHTRPSAGPGSPAILTPPLGMEPTTLLGGLAMLALDGRDDRYFPTRGYRGEIVAELYPGAAGGSGPFSRVDARGSVYLPIPLGGTTPILALRGGGSRAVGEFPFFEAAYLGGSRHLRGYSTQRFAGDLSLFGGVELRAPLAPLELVVRGTGGVLGFMDAGRVYLDGSSPGGWHTGAGGGLWFATPVGAVSLAYARGEKQKVYLKMGMPF